ncbi:site-specific integrase [Luteitalea sp. TBR-22]|uniref:tyrosine-type recombinase/integrase n=1 Tax=Luteitalea sp. TBR-22 TaxID=2802971 RepID=UPI001EF40A0A|nr:site-specific integrase [Luteitalea sp. TBR-22]
MTSRSAALRWGQNRERELLLNNTAPSPSRTDSPRLREFAPRFMDGHARAERQKPSGLAAKETILRVHLLPHMGRTPLHAIDNESVQRLKSALTSRSPKTVNNVLTVLNKLLKTAVEWGVIEQMPCAVRLLKVPKTTARFYDFHEYERLLAAAEALHPMAHLIVLLGGDAGLRCGEMMALEWRDVNWQKRQLVIERSDWKGHVTATKGGRVRYVPLSDRLEAALLKYQDKRMRVLHDRYGVGLTQKEVQDWMKRAAKRAGVRQGVHILRHSFCSHLAMKGAPARAIQELAGHENLATTQRYMHLSPSALDQAIALLNGPRSADPLRGEIVEKGRG